MFVCCVFDCYVQYIIYLFIYLFIEALFNGIVTIWGGEETTEKNT